MRWFGESWDAPVCEEGEHVPTPTGACGICDAAIRERDQGLILVRYGPNSTVLDFPVHIDCLLSLVEPGAVSDPDEDD